MESLLSRHINTRKKRSFSPESLSIYFLYVKVICGEDNYLIFDFRVVLTISHETIARAVLTSSKLITAQRVDLLSGISGTFAFPVHNSTVSFIYIYIYIYY